MRKAVTVLGVIFLIIIVLVGGLFWGLQTPAGQNYLTRQATAFLRKKLQTRVDVAKIRFDIPDWITLEGVYIEDQKGDTLLAGERLYVNLDMLSLIKGNIGINQIELEGMRANITRVLPDTAYNFQFIVDAFVTDAPPTAADTVATPLEMRLDELVLKRVYLTYQDAITGTDAEANVQLAQVQFAEFNPTRSLYHPSRLVMNGTRASLRLYEPLVPSISNAADQVDTLDLKLGDVKVQNLTWSFVDEVAGIKNGIQLGRLEGRIERIFLGSQQADLRNVLLENTTAFVEMAARPAAANAPPASADTATAPGWQVRIGDLVLSNNRLRYDDFGQPRQPRGLDYAHLDVRNLSTKLTDFVFSPETISGKLASLSFQDKSGFAVQELRTSFAYAARETYLRDFYLKTPHSILRDELVLKYQSQQQLTDNPEKVQVRLQLRNSQLAFRDLLLLAPDLAQVPPFNKNPTGYLSGTGLVTGTVDNLLISKADFRTLSGTRLALDGRIRGLPNTDRLAVDLSIRELASTRQDLLLLIPEGSVPTTIELPEQVALKGRVQGTLANLTMDAALTSSLGAGTFDGTIQNASTPDKARYNGRLSFTDFDIGRFLKQPPEELGKITLSTQLEGQGFDPATMQARVDGTLQSASVKGYVYNNLNLTGTMANGKANFEAGIQDENIALQVTLQADVSQEYPTVQATAQVDRLNLKALNLYTENVSLAGNINLDFTSTDPENPLGVLSATQLVITNDGQPIAIDSLNLVLRNDQGTREAVLYAPFLKARLSGEFNYPQLGTIVLSEVNKYFTVTDTTYAPVTTPYDVQLEARMANHPALQTFVPELTRLDTVRLSARLTNQSDTTLSARLTAPDVLYDTIQVTNASLNLAGTNDIALISGRVGEVKYNDFRVRRAFLDGEAANNSLVFDFAVKDSLDENRHAIAGRLLALEGDQYRFHLRQGLLLDYRPWQTDSTGYLQYGPAGLLVQDFSIRRTGQQLVINSTGDQPNSPLRIQADSIAIGPFVALVTQDTTLASGTLDGTFLLSNYTETATFTGDLLVNNLNFMQIPIGDLSVKASNETASRINVEASLKSPQNDVVLTGYYLPDAASPMNFDMNIRQLGAKTIEAFSFEQLRRARGSLVGQVQIRGSTDSPVLNGEIAFDSVAFEVAQLGSLYHIHQNQIQLRNQLVRFTDFVIKDSLNNDLKVNGTVDISTIPDVGYNLVIDATNFIVLDASRRDNEFFYGNGSVDAHITVKGVGTESIIDGNVKLLPGSDVTIILPDDAAGAQSTEGVVRFIDKSNPEAQPADSAVANQGLRVDFASELSLNLEATDKSQLTIIVDELNGDNLKVRGNAQLNTGIAPNGQLYLVGLYELSEGSYDLTFQVLKREFSIQKGSQLLWTGDPMKAEVDITAVYTVSADMAALGPAGTSFGKVPLDVLLKMQGNLSNPLISFDITVSSTVPDDDATAIQNANLLGELQNNPAEMNKQVFALLVLNRFITDQGGSSGAGFSAEALARQSVSQLLSEQLNLLASNFVQGVNLNFNLNSTAEGSTARTDLNIGLSKAFLDDRLTVAVGRNFELENAGANATSNEIFDNLAVNYALTKDGRYLVRAYRKNQYQAVLEGFIVETGVSFIVNMDYNKFRELFLKTKP
jgi:translocation and assembly module TamB